MLKTALTKVAPTPHTITKPSSSTENGQEKNRRQMYSQLLSGSNGLSMLISDQKLIFSLGLVCPFFSRSLFIFARSTWWALITMAYSLPTNIVVCLLQPLHQKNILRERGENFSVSLIIYWNLEPSLKMDEDRNWPVSVSTKRRPVLALYLQDLKFWFFCES